MSTLNFNKIKTSFDNIATYFLASFQKASFFNMLVASRGRVIFDNEDTLV